MIPNQNWWRRTSRAGKSGQKSENALPASPLTSQPLAENTMIKKQELRDRAVDAIDILNDLMNEIMTGVEVYNHYLVKHKAGIISFDGMASAQRLCFTSIFLALNKIREFNRRYLRIVPEYYRVSLKELQDIIVERGIPDYRDHCIGHIWDSSANQPVKHSEVNRRLSVIIGGKTVDFLNWLHITGKTETVAGILEAVRDALMTEYSVGHDEIIDR